MRRHKAKMLLAILLMLGVFSAFTMFIWNTVLTVALGLASITFWQALGLLVLCRVLFGGLGFRGFMHGGMPGQRPDHWHKMDPEQKRELLERFGGFHERFHGHPGMARRGFGPEGRQPGFGRGEHPRPEHAGPAGRRCRPDGSRCCGRAEPCKPEAEPTVKAAAEQTGEESK